MNQYIITEEQLDILYKFIQHCPDYVTTIGQEVRSHPYQNERDKVLDLTSLEFAHLVFMLGGCKCEMCQRISVKLVKLRQQAGEP
jgi:hypothetical protein